MFLVPYKQLYLIDVTKLDQKWRKFLRDHLDDRLNTNDAAYNLYWDDFDCPNAYIDGTDISKHQEFKKLMTEAGIPPNAEVWLNYWW